MSIRDSIKKHRKGLIIGFGAFVSYLGIYAAMSASGEYRPSPCGKIRHSSGLAVMDRTLWQPKGMYFVRRLDVQGRSKTDADLGGYIFAPLIVVDRANWHPTINYLEE